MTRLSHLLCSLSYSALFLLFSCDSLRHEVTPGQLTNEPAKVVVTCFLSPQDLVLAAKITQTQTVLGLSTGVPDSSSVINAVVKLSEGNRSVFLRYDANLNLYRADSKQLPVLAGRTYRLVVQIPRKQPLTSSCTIPESVKLSGTVFDSLTEERSGRLYRRYFVRARWQDPNGKPNFYQVTGLFRSVVNCSSCVPASIDQTPEEVTHVSFGPGQGGVQGDGTMQGRVMTSEPGYVSGIYIDAKQQTGFKRQYRKALVILNLLNTDKSYYAYQNGIRQQAAVAGNPFAEPVPIPSNIDGALGCFGAYNRSTLSLKLIK